MKPVIKKPKVHYFKNLITTIQKETVEELRKDLSEALGLGPLFPGMKMRPKEGAKK